MKEAKKERKQGSHQKNEMEKSKTQKYKMHDLFVWFFMSNIEEKRKQIVN